MEKLTESEIYIIDSLFERKQIDKQRLIKAISILPVNRGYSKYYIQ